MIYDNIQFHNVVEMRPVKGLEGLRMQRVPEKVRVCLNPIAREKVLNPWGVEIRFINVSPKVKITLSCPEGICEVLPIWGQFQAREKIIIDKEIKTIELEYPKKLKLLTNNEYKCPFSLRTWRLLLRGDPVHYISVSGGVTPPQKEDLPDTSFIFYGTSITQGKAASGMHLSYVNQFSSRLGVDVINLGVSGSAYCEKELADHIAARKDWDAAVLEISVNMVARFNLREFTKRIIYMLNTIVLSNPVRKVICITLLPFFKDLKQYSRLVDDDRPENFREALRKVVNDMDSNNVYLIEGASLLTNLSGLSADLLHPSDIGMVEIGDNLARYIDQIIYRRKS